MDSGIVLDSSAILAFFHQEVGVELVAEVMHGALLSTVNLAEVHTKLLLKGASPEFAWSRIFQMSLVIVPFDIEQARLAAEMIPATRSYGLSLGDRACLALATVRKAAVCTADRAWKNFPLEIDIRVIR